MNSLCNTDISAYLDDSPFGPRTFLLNSLQ